MCGEQITETDASRANPVGDAQQIEHLERALRSSRRIGAAVGIVMATAKLNYDDAFAWLVAMSQRTNRKLRDVADDVLLTGEVTPTRPASSSLATR